jgi:hypothetical protein
MTLRRTVLGATRAARAARVARAAWLVSPVPGPVAAVEAPGFLPPSPGAGPPRLRGDPSHSLSNAEARPCLGQPTRSGAVPGQLPIPRPGQPLRSGPALASVIATMTLRSRRMAFR